MYRNSKAVSFKELFDYSPISTSAEKSRYVLRNGRNYKDVDIENKECFRETGNSCPEVPPSHAKRVYLSTVFEVRWNLAISKW
jgi:hypothetical protein